jgi:hypothetical protein
MTQDPKKPEWFEIAESDNAAAAVTKVDKKLTVLAAIVAGGIIAAGAFFANATESTPAQADNVSPIAATTAAVSPSTNSTTPSGTTAPLGVENPSQSGIQAPNGGEEEDEFGDRPDHDDEDHERDEHRERGERGEHHEDRDHDDD